MNTYDVMVCLENIQELVQHLNVHIGALLLCKPEVWLCESRSSMMTWTTISRNPLHHLLCLWSVSLIVLWKLRFVLGGDNIRSRWKPRLIWKLSIKKIQRDKKKKKNLKKIFINKMTFHFKWTTMIVVLLHPLFRTRLRQLSGWMFFFCSSGRRVDSRSTKNLCLWFWGAGILHQRSRRGTCVQACSTAVQVYVCVFLCCT